jgi:hypothetical protein
MSCLAVVILVWSLGALAPLHDLIFHCNLYVYGFLKVMLILILFTFYFLCRPDILQQIKCCWQRSGTDVSEPIQDQVSDDEKQSDVDLKPDSGVQKDQNEEKIDFIDSTSDQVQSNSTVVDENTAGKAKIEKLNILNNSVESTNRRNIKDSPVVTSVSDEINGVQTIIPAIVDEDYYIDAKNLSLLKYLFIDNTNTAKYSTLSSANLKNETSV